MNLEPTNRSAAGARAPGRSFRLARIGAARPWQTNAALLLLGSLLFLLSRHLLSEYDTYTIGFSGTSGWSVVVYLAAAFLVLTQPVDRWTFPIILGVSIICRLATLFADPVLSSDVYRYVWDGVVQHAGLNPYRYVPGNPALSFLREPNLDVFNSINRRDYARTIYPPFAQVLFFVSTFISPTLLMMKTTMVLFEGLTMWALLQICHHLGIRREQTLLYAWCPLLIWEIAGSGHLDSAVFALTTLALLFRLRRQAFLTGLFLGLAVLTKFYPLVLFPALYMFRAPDPKTERPVSCGRRVFERLDWTMPGTMLALAVVLYAAYSSVGKLVFGFLGGYVEEEGMSTGTRYFLLEQARHIPGLRGLTPAAYVVFAAVVLLVLSLWGLRVSWTARLDNEAAFLWPTFALAAALMLLFSPHYSWYVAWLIPFFALLPNLPIAAYILGLFYLCTTALAVGSGPKQFLLNQILYGSVLIACVLDLALRRSSVGRALCRRLRSYA